MFQYSELESVFFSLSVCLHAWELLATKNNSVALSPHANYTERPPLVDEI
jgi:hypothetical protein